MVACHPPALRVHDRVLHPDGD